MKNNPCLIFKEVYGYLFYYFFNVLYFSFFKNNYAAAAKSLQLCPTLYDRIDSNPPGSPVPGILQARTL